MEERQVIRSYKFGVVMLLPGQTLEYQGLTNTRGMNSSPFSHNAYTHVGVIIRRKSIRKRSREKSEEGAGKGKNQLCSK